jgi:ABC-type arginine/histidine transport system permease subunit
MLIHTLQGAAVVALLLGLAAILSPRLGRWAGWGMVAVLVGAPVLRVVRLAFTWRGEGDRRFARLAVLLLMVLIVGAASAGLRALLVS